MSDFWSGFAFVPMLFWSGLQSIGVTVPMLLKIAGAGSFLLVVAAICWLLYKKLAAKE
jgi:hypothetical protein